jgi:hypothetical protein
VLSSFQTWIRLPRAERIINRYIREGKIPPPEKKPNRAVPAAPASFAEEKSGGERCDDVWKADEVAGDGENIEGEGGWNFAATGDPEAG